MKLKLLDGIYCALSYKMHGGHPGILPDNPRTLMSLTLALYVFDIALFFGLVLEVFPIILVLLITYVLGPIVAIIWYFSLLSHKNRDTNDPYS